MDSSTSTAMPTPEGPARAGASSTGGGGMASLWPLWTSHTWVMRNPGRKYSRYEHLKSLLREGSAGSGRSSRQESVASFPEIWHSSTSSIPLGGDSSAAGKLV